MVEPPRVADLTCAGCGKQAPRRHHRQKFCRVCAEKRTPRKTNKAKAAVSREKYNEKIGSEAVTKQQVRSLRKARARRSLEDYLEQALHRLL